MNPERVPSAAGHRRWPSARARAKNVRFLNPFEEQDYGEHIFEDPETHLLMAATPAGDFHITMLDLNAPFLVRKRRDRAACLILRAGHWSNKPGKWDQVEKMRESIKAFMDDIDLMIPPIPPPPEGVECWVPVGSC